MKSGRRIKCKRCGYTWNTSSKNIYTSCPSCKTSVKVRSIAEKK